MKDPVDGHLIPYDNVTLAGKAILADIKNAGSMFNAVGTPVAFDPANAALLALPTNAGAPYGARAPFGATSATLEYFGNMPVVNGVVYGKYNVEPRMYRMRFIGGTDSRTWLMQLQANDAAKTIIPFWVIGTEQGLLNTPVQRDLIDLMPGERVDVLVDFSKIPAGTTRVMMNNLGDDAPWAGYFDYLAQTIAVPPAIPPGYPRSILIPEIMAFDIVPLVGTDNIAKPTINTALRPGVQVPVNPPTPIQNTRVVSLMEITDAFGRTMPTIDSRGFKPVGVPVTEIIKLNDIEQWDIVNTTVDAHPMHLHQVAFRVISRQLIDPAGFVAPTDDVVNQLFTAPTYTVALNSTPILPDAWDAGWKDTVASPPGYVTRVWAKFDLTGEYVWHCHILSHEEHDMMRNFIVTDASFTAPAPLSISVPATSNNGSYTVSWVGTAIPGVTYELQESTDPLFPATTATTTINTGNVPRFDAINKAAGSTYYYRVRSVPPVVVGQAKNFTTSPWRTGANGVTSQRVVITAPLPGNVPVGLTTISATVPAPAGLVTVKRVEFFVNGVLAGTAAGTTSLTYSVTNVTLAVGLYNLTAIAYYSDNTTSTSVAVTVTAAGAAATISLDSPATGATFDLGTAITLAATPSVVANTTVAWVLFYDGTTPVGIIDPTVPGFTTYSMSYTPATAGARSMSARVYYNNGIQATSASSAVTINGTVIAPASITVPTNSPINTSYSVSWTTAVSPTIGATYTLEESTSPTFDVLNTTTVTSGLQTTSVLISGKLTNGAKYYYRVMAVKSPMTSSAWITTNPIDVGLNVALQVNGGVATASSTFSTAYPASGVINGDRASGWGSGGAWTDATPNAYPDWVEIAFSGQKNISEIDVFTLQDAYSTPVIPTTTMTATLYGLIAFDVQYWDGVNNWITVPGGSITNNTLVWNKITFSSISTDRIRVNVNSARGASRIVEIEAWMADTTIPTVSISAPQSGALFTNPAQVTLVASATAVVGRSISKVEFYNGSTLLGTSPSAVNPYSFNWSNVPTGAYNITAIAYDNTNTSSVSAPLVVTVTGPLNVALASNGGTALASSEYSAAYPASGVINGDRIGGWGFGGAWTDATPNAYPDWVQITFNGPKTINEVDVFTLQDAYAVPVVPTPTLTATLYSLIAFDVEYWDGAAWVIVPGGSITNNTLVWNKINFPAITTSQIRVNVTAGRGGSSRIVEIEAWAP
jgi:FtsP/CotA-like multicopper oxidase with cupredoxin domain